MFCAIGGGCIYFGSKYFTVGVFKIIGGGAGGAPANLPNKPNQAPIADLLKEKDIKSSVGPINEVGSNATVSNNTGYTDSPATVSNNIEYKDSPATELGLEPVQAGLDNMLLNEMNSLDTSSATVSILGLANLAAPITLLVVLTATAEFRGRVADTPNTVQQDTERMYVN